MRFNRSGEMRRGGIDGGRGAVSWSAAACVLGLTCLAAPSSAAAEQPRRAVPVVALYSIFSDTDYPTEAIAKNEQGAVTFRLTVGSDGGVSDCAILGSSGSALLDATTCRILAERARFKPAADAKGKLVSDSHTGRITWRLPTDNSPDPVQTPPGLNTAMELWSVCIRGESAKQILSPLAPGEIVKRGLEACTQLEGLASREMTKAKVPGLEPSKLLPAFKEQISSELVAALEQARSVLRGAEKD
jgi:TonB family protein